MITEQNLKAIQILRDDFMMDNNEIVDNFGENGVTIFLTDIPPKEKRANCIEFNGVKRTASDWARLMGINESTLLTRINRGWPIERALGQKLARNKSTKAKA